MSLQIWQTYLKNIFLTILRWEIYSHCSLLSSSAAGPQLKICQEDHHHLMLLIFLGFNYKFYKIFISHFNVFYISQFDIVFTVPHIEMCV